MTEIHNFKVGDIVNVYRISPFTKSRYREGKAIIVSLKREEDMYTVQFAFRGDKFEGRKHVRYVDPNQEESV
jgi:hypothetical protein